MLSTNRIMSVIAADKYSNRKKQARIGQKYYEGRHDILDYRVFYIDKNGKLQEDLTKSNIRAPHPFFQEIAEQEVAYILSGGICFHSAQTELNEALKMYFGDEFIGEMQEILTDTVVRGFGYVYWYRNEKGRTKFCHADSMGIVEVKDGEATDTVNDYIIRYYPVAVKDNCLATRVEVWDANMTYYYLMYGGALELDNNIKINPCPHILYREGGQYYYEESNQLPFLRLDNNKQQQSGVKQIKPIIDDYDLMDCGLSNNLQDIAEGIYVVKGFKGTSTDELMWNVKSRRVVGVSEKGDVDIRTINIPYEARKEKLEIDEKNIYRFALAFNSSQSGDGNITNIVLISRYTLLDMKCKKLIIRLKKFLQQLLMIALEEINAEMGTAWEAADVEIKIVPVIPTNKEEDAEIEKINAETKQIQIGMVLDVAAVIDTEILIKEICQIMELNYDEVKEKLLEPGELEVIKGVLNGELSERGTNRAAGS